MIYLRKTINFEGSQYTHNILVHPIYKLENKNVQQIGQHNICGKGVVLKENT